MKRKQSETAGIKYTVMETTAPSGTYVEFMPQLWLIPPKNKTLQHKERDTVKYLYPRKLPQQSKDSFIKFVKHAKFNGTPAERNEKWELRDGRILKMGIDSLEEALDAEKFYSDYFSSTEGEKREEKVPTPAKKTVRKKKKNDHKPNDSETEEDEQGYQIPNYNIHFQQEANDQVFTLDAEDEQNILDQLNQVMNENPSTSLQSIQVADTLFAEGNLPNLCNEKFITIEVPTARTEMDSQQMQRNIFDDDDEDIEATGDTANQQSSCTQNCCKLHQKVMNKIDYLQKKWFKELSLLRQEGNANRQLLLRVLNLLSPTERQAEDILDDQIEENRGEGVARPILDMAELDKFNERYKATFPISSSDFIIEFNKSLKDDENFADNLYDKLSLIKAEDETKTVRKILKEICDVRCMKDFTWHGTKKMKSFQELHLVIEMISQLLKEKFKDCDAYDVIMKVVKQRTKSAKEAYDRLLASEAASTAALQLTVQNKIAPVSTITVAANNIAEKSDSISSIKNVESTSASTLTDDVNKSGDRGSFHLEDNQVAISTTVDKQDSITTINLNGMASVSTKLNNENHRVAGGA